MQRARIQQWLFYTATALRKCTLGLFAPIFRPDVASSDTAKADVVMATRALRVAEEQLSSHDWLAGGRGPSLADIAAYQEIGQLQSKFVDLFDFGPFPRIRAWLARCEALPQWAETHAKPMALGRKLKQRILSKLWW